MATYDDFRWHVESEQFPDTLPDEKAFDHIALYLCWIAERELASEAFALAFAQHQPLLERFRAGEAPFGELSTALREATDGALASEQLGEDGDSFTDAYYEELYPSDWESAIFYEETDSPYHVVPTAEHLADLYELIDQQHASWAAGEWETDALEGTARLWDLEDGEQLIGTPGEVAAISPDGMRLAVADIDGTITMFEVASGGVLGHLLGHEAQVLALAFSPDGKRLASSAADATVRVWDTEAGDELITFEGADELVDTLQFTPDGKRLLTVGHPLDFFLDDDEAEALAELEGELEGEEDLDVEADAAAEQPA